MSDSLRILATSDWQLDMAAHSLCHQARHHLSQARLSTVKRILQLAEKEKVDHILVAGDLFEYPSPSSEVISAVASILQAHRTIPIHAIPGNHDLAGPGTVWSSPEFQGIDHFHLYKELSCVDLGKGVFLHAIPVKSRYDTINQDEQLPDVTEERGIHIVMAHGHDLDTMDLTHEECKLPLRSASLSEKGYALVVLGHWHSWNQVAENVLYPGTHEQTKFGEHDAGNVALIQIPTNGGEPAIKKQKVGQLSWERSSIDCTGQPLPETVVSHVQSLSEKSDFLELTLTGEVSLDESEDALHRARLSSIPMVSHLKWVDQTQLTIDIDEMTQKLSLPMGLREVQQAILEEINAHLEDEERTTLLRAELRAMYEACRNTDVLGDEEVSL